MQKARLLAVSLCRRNSLTSMPPRSGIGWHWHGGALLPSFPRSPFPNVISSGGEGSQSSQALCLDYLEAASSAPSIPSTHTAPQVSPKQWLPTGPQPPALHPQAPSCPPFLPSPALCTHLSSPSLPPASGTRSRWPIPGDPPGAAGEMQAAQQGRGHLLLAQSRAGTQGQRECHRRRCRCQGAGLLGQ